MPITRSYSNNFEIQDYTMELQIVPNSWTMLNESGLFTPEYVTTKSVTFEEQNSTLALLGDAYWGQAPQAAKQDTRKIHSYSIPHFPGVDTLTPSDISAVRAYGSTDAAETEAAAVARRIAKARRSLDITREVAAFKTLTTLNAYAPNGTIVGNFATDFGVTQTVVNFALGTAGTEVIAKVEEVVAAIQDNAQTGDVMTEIVGYAGPAFFAALIAHPKVSAAYTYFAANVANQNILRERAGGFETGLYRQFVLGNVRFIEVRTPIAGSTLVPTDECHFIPLGTTDTFMRYHAPADRFGLVNTVAEDAYLWTFRDPKGTKIDIEYETNFLHVIRRPGLVVRATRV